MLIKLHYVSHNDLWKITNSCKSIAGFPSLIIQESLEQKETKMLLHKNLLAFLLIQIGIILSKGKWHLKGFDQ